MYFRAQFSISVCTPKHPPNIYIMPHHLGYLSEQLGQFQLKRCKTFRQEQPSWGFSVGFVRGQQGCIYRLHAGGAGEGAHQPGVYAIHMVDVKTRQESNGITVLKIHHANYTLFNFLVRGVRAWVEDSSGQVLDETDSLGNADLLLLSQLASQTTLTWGGMVHWHWLGVLLVGRRWRLSGQTAPLGLV